MIYKAGCISLNPSQFFITYVSHIKSIKVQHIATCWQIRGKHIRFGNEIGLFIGLRWSKEFMLWWCEPLGQRVFFSCWENNMDIFSLAIKQINISQWYAQRSLNICKDTFFDWWVIFCSITSHQNINHLITKHYDLGGIVGPVGRDLGGIVGPVGRERTDNSLTLGECDSNLNKANMRDLIAATGLVISL